MPALHKLLETALAHNAAERAALEEIKRALEHVPAPSIKDQFGKLTEYGRAELDRLLKADELGGSAIARELGITPSAVTARRRALERTVVVEVKKRAILGRGAQAGDVLPSKTTYATTEIRPKPLARIPLSDN